CVGEAAVYELLGGIGRRQRDQCVAFQRRPCSRSRTKRGIVTRTDDNQRKAKEWYPSNACGGLEKSPEADVESSPLHLLPDPRGLRLEQLNGKVRSMPAEFPYGVRQDVCRDQRRCPER